MCDISIYLQVFYNKVYKNLKCKVLKKCSVTFNCKNGPNKHVKCDDHTVIILAEVRGSKLGYTAKFLS